MIGIDSMFLGLMWMTKSMWNRCWWYIWIQCLCCKLPVSALASKPETSAASEFDIFWSPNSKSPRLSKSAKSTSPPTSDIFAVALFLVGDSDFSSHNSSSQFFGFSNEFRSCAISSFSGLESMQAVESELGLLLSSPVPTLFGGIGNRCLGLCNLHPTRMWDV